MIQTVEGEIYRIDAETDEDIMEFADQFFSGKNHITDLIAVDGYIDETIYISYMDYQNNRFRLLCLFFYSYVQGCAKKCSSA